MIRSAGPGPADTGKCGVGRAGGLCNNVMEKHLRSGGERRNVTKEPPCRSNGGGLVVSQSFVSEVTMT